MWVRGPRQFRDAVFHVWHWDGTVLDSDLGPWMGLDADDCQGLAVASLSQAEALGGICTLLAVLSLSSLCVLSLSLVWYPHFAYSSHPPRCAILLLTTACGFRGCAIAVPSSSSTLPAVSEAVPHRCNYLVDAPTTMSAHRCLCFQRLVPRLERCFGRKRPAHCFRGWSVDEIITTACGCWSWEQVWLK